METEKSGSLCIGDVRQAMKLQIEQFSFFEWDPNASEDSKKLELDVACGKPLDAPAQFPFLEIKDFV